MQSIACIGAGNIGRAWAICFARAGRDVRLYDARAEAVDHARDLIRASLDDLSAHGMLSPEAADAAHGRITPVGDLAEAVDGAAYVQESIIEDLDVKRSFFAELDAMCADEAILASSSSEFMSSQFCEGLPGAGRILNAHPFNPPFLIPLVEICANPAVSEETVAATRALLDEIGMRPVVVRKEVKGFLLNRLQVAVVAEALHLVGEGYCSASDLDTAMEQGIGLRWAFMGPFLTGHLNASSGYSEYMRTFDGGFRRMAGDLHRELDWTLSLIDEVNDELATRFPNESVEEAQRWRDQRLMALLKHKASQPDFKTS